MWPVFDSTEDLHLSKNKLALTDREQNTLYWNGAPLYALASQKTNADIDFACRITVDCILQVAILLCFVTELALRNIAKGRRFWQDPWCIFDVSVRTRI
jgi:hypothetical protein